MVALDVLVQNLMAALLVWSWALIGGIPWSRLLWKCRSASSAYGDNPSVGPGGFGGCVLLGVAYWGVIVYVFPFRHGLDLAAALAIVGCVWSLRGPMPVRSLFVTKHKRALAILMIGCGSYASVLLTQYVPPGMDASMHATSARLIAENRGLPTTYAPFAPSIAFPSVNIGLPTLGGIAVRCGAQPAAAMLAAEQFTFAAFILATYLLIRVWIRPMAASLLAVFVLWASRAAQETLGWGGFPTLAGLALGVFAVRLLRDAVRRPSYRVGIPLGLVVASLPLVHGIAGGVWIYAVAPVLAVYVVAQCRQRWSGLKPLAAAVPLTLSILAMYLTFGLMTAPAEDVDSWHDYQRQFYQAEFPEQGWALWLRGASYVKSAAGSDAVWCAAAAIGVLLLRRSFREALALSAVYMTLCLIVVNARYEVLPMSFLLYPERTVLFATPLAAVAMAMAWRHIPARWQVSLGALFAVVLIADGAMRHIQFFQRSALRPAITDGDWRALRWAAVKLDAACLVDAPYKSAGSYLPAVAGIASTGMHMHYFCQSEMHELLRQRLPTHLLQSGKGYPGPGEIVFRNDAATISDLRPGQARGHSAKNSRLQSPNLDRQ